MKSAHEYLLLAQLHLNVGSVTEAVALLALQWQAQDATTYHRRVYLATRPQPTETTTPSI